MMFRIKGELLKETQEQNINSFVMATGKLVRFRTVEYNLNRNLTALLSIVCI